MAPRSLGKSAHTMHGYKYHALIVPQSEALATRALLVIQVSTLHLS